MRNRRYNFIQDLFFRIYDFFFESTERTQCTFLLINGVFSGVEHELIIET